MRLVEYYRAQPRGTLAHKFYGLLAKVMFKTKNQKSLLHRIQLHQTAIEGEGNAFRF
jgi:hypothetical protein